MISLAHRVAIVSRCCSTSDIISPIQNSVTSMICSDIVRQWTCRQSSISYSLITTNLDFSRAWRKDRHMSCLDYHYFIICRTILSLWSSVTFFSQFDHDNTAETSVNFCMAQRKKSGTFRLAILINLQSRHTIRYKPVNKVLWGEFPRSQPYSQLHAKTPSFYYRAAIVACTSKFLFVSSSETLSWKHLPT